MIACLDPGVGRAQLAGEGHAPVVAVLLVWLRKKADVSVPDTKGRESWRPKHFSLQKGRFQGTTKGAKMPIADPSARRLSAPGAREYPRTSRAARRQPSRLLIPHLAAGPARAARLVCALLRVAWVRPGGRRSLARNWRALSSGVRNHAEHPWLSRESRDLGPAPTACHPARRRRPGPHSIKCALVQAHSISDSAERARFSPYLPACG
jgi:hypothetical protein